MRHQETKIRKSPYKNENGAILNPEVIFLASIHSEVCWKSIFLLCWQAFLFSFGRGRGGASLWFLSLPIQLVWFYDWRKPVMDRNLIYLDHSSFSAKKEHKNGSYGGEKRKGCFLLNRKQPFVLKQNWSTQNPAKICMACHIFPWQTADFIIK